MSHRLNDSSLELQECFSWSTKWRSAPTYTICGINEIVQQLARTLVRDQMMGKTASTSCRLCNQHPETVEHILSACPELAQRLYFWRHNDALKHVLSALLMKNGFRNKPLSQNQEPKSYYINQDRCAEIMWDCSVMTETRALDEGNQPELQIIDQEEKRIDILEMACPSWQNRAETSVRKKDQEVPNSER